MILNKRLKTFVFCEHYGTLWNNLHISATFQCVPYISVCHLVLFYYIVSFRT